MFFSTLFAKPPPAIVNALRANLHGDFIAVITLILRLIIPGQDGDFFVQEALFRFSHTPECKFSRVTEIIFIGKVRACVYDPGQGSTHVLIIIIIRFPAVSFAKDVKRAQVTAALQPDVAQEEIKFRILPISLAYSLV
jgi:hypothetical protein